MGHVSAAQPTTRPDRSERLFGALLALFPRDFRDRFGDDMAELFRDQLRAARQRGGRRGVAELWLRTAPALARAAALERRDAFRLTAHSFRSDTMLETLGADLRFAVRMLRKSPLFTLVAVVCISLGSGAVTTIFSAMNALVLRPLPGTSDAGRLVRVERTHPGAEGHVSLSYAYYDRLRTSARTLGAVAAWSKASLTIRSGDEMGTAAYGNFVSGNFFSVLGVRPALGRFFVPEEDRADAAHPVVVVSERFWRAHLGADSSAVGRDVTVNGHRFTLVGVAAREFQGPDVPVQADAWVPLGTWRLLRPSAGALQDPAVNVLTFGARLAPGVSADAAQHEIEALTAAFADERTEPEWLHKFTDVRLSPMTALPSDARRVMAGFLGLLLGAAAFVLLIASVNIAAMLSARAVARRREMAVRAALGAGRGRILRQLLTEILTLFVVGAGGGAAIAIVATSALERISVPGAVPIRLELSPDPRVFAFALLVSLLTGAVVGLAPALRAARADVADQLRNGSAGSGTRRSLVGNALVVAQLALSLVLLVGAGLFVQTLRHGHRIDPGFDGTGVATVPLDAEAWGYDEARGRTLFRGLAERVTALPGVTAVSYASVLPLGLQSSGDDFAPEGGAATDANGRAPVQLIGVADGYFSVLRIPLTAGRAITRQDDERAAKVAVVNETLVRRHWPTGDAVGRTFTFRGQRVTVVGVARDAKYASLAEATPPLVYLPLAQQWETRQSLIVRTAADPAALAPAIRDAMRAIDPELPRPTVTPLTTAMRLGLLPQRVAALVTGALGALGLLLATVGLYGIIAYSASRRTREIGIRLALGARRGDVLRMIVRQGMRLTALGVATGLLLAGGATRLLAGLLFGVSPLDGLTYVAVASVFVAVALVASWLPARRAAGANPAVVLRGE